MAKCFYAVLGVDTNSSQAEIKRAFHKLALQTHPDKNENTAEQFKLVNAAHETLSDPAQRKAYDDKMGYSSQNGSHNGSHMGSQPESFNFPGAMHPQFGAAFTMRTAYYRYTRSRASFKPPSHMFSDYASSFFSDPFPDPFRTEMPTATPRRRPAAHEPTPMSSEDSESPPEQPSPDVSPINRSTEEEVVRIAVQTGEAHIGGGVYLRRGTRERTSHWRTRVSEALQRRNRRPTVIDLTDDGPLSGGSGLAQEDDTPRPWARQSRHETGYQSKRGPTDRDTSCDEQSEQARPGKRARFDFTEMKHTTPMMQTNGDFGMDGMRDAIYGDPFQSSRSASAESAQTDGEPYFQPTQTPSGPAELELPMQSYFPTGWGSIEVPAPPTFRATGSSTAEIIGANEQYLGEFKDYYLKHLEFSQTIAGCLHGGYEALKDRGLTEVISRQKVADLYHAGARDVQIIESWLESLKRHLSTLEDLHSRS